MATSVVLVAWNQLELPRAFLDAPFVHHSGGTGAGAPCRRDEALQQRRAALRRFAAKWGHRMTSDVRSRWRRVHERCVPRDGARRRS